MPQAIFLTLRSVSQSRNSSGGATARGPCSQELRTWLSRSDKSLLAGSFPLVEETNRPTRKSVSEGDKAHEEKIKAGRGLEQGLWPEKPLRGRPGRGAERVKHTHPQEGMMTPGRGHPVPAASGPCQEGFQGRVDTQGSTKAKTWRGLESRTAV